jgi:hypothetical protein
VCEESKSIFALIVVFTIDERKVVVEKCADFAAGFSKTLLLKDDRYSVSARVLYCSYAFIGCIHLAAKLVSVALVFFGLAFPTFSFSFLKSFFLSFLCLLDLVIL